MRKGKNELTNKGLTFPDNFSIVFDRTYLLPSMQIFYPEL